MKPGANKLADIVTDGITKNWSQYNARPYALAALVALNEAGFVIVPKAPTNEWIMRLDDRYMVNDQTSPGGGALAKMIERVLATAPTIE